MNFTRMLTYYKEKRRRGKGGTRHSHLCIK